MSRRFVDKVALLLSDESRFIKEVKRTSKQTKRERILEIYGVTDATLVNWLTARPDDAAIEKLCNSFNNYRKGNAQLEAASMPFEEDGTDFGDQVECFEFARKLGYASVQWFDVQQHMNKVQFANSLLGREHSMDAITARKVADRFIGERMTGACFLYFKSYTVNSNTKCLQRATLRIQREVEVKADRFYVPVKIKQFVPTFSAPRKTVRTYLGYVTLRNNRLYFSLSDEDGNSDFIEMIIGVGHLFGKKHWTGIYTSVTGHATEPTEYSSVVHLERREVGSTEDASKTLDFMNNNMNTFNNPSELDEKKHNNENKKFRDYLRELLKSSPWPEIESTKRQTQPKVQG